MWYWPVFSNATYLLAVGAGLWRRRFFPAFILAVLMLVSSWHHYCHADDDACAQRMRTEMQRVDHVLAIWVSAVLFLLLVPFTDQDALWERLMYALLLGGALLAVYLGLDTAYADVAAASVIAGGVIVAASAVRVGLHSSTLGWLRRLSHMHRAVWACALLLAGFSVFIWFYSDWSDDPLWHGFWHVTTALVATLLLAFVPRAEERVSLFHPLPTMA
jgi:hypothetical protein